MSSKALKEIFYIFIYLCFLAILIFAGFTSDGRDMADKAIYKVDEGYKISVNYIKEKISDLYYERKEIVEEEIEKEKLTLEEMIVSAGRNLFSRIGDFVYRIPLLIRE